MELKDLPYYNQIDQVNYPVFSLVTETAFVGESAPHQHAKAQLLYAISGTLTVMVAAGGIWTVPPNCALWIPSGVPHMGRGHGHMKVGSLYVEPERAALMGTECAIILVRPFLRELLHRFSSQPWENISQERTDRLIAVLLDELIAAPVEPIYLPMPTDRRLRRLVNAIIESPGERSTVEDWSARAGASSRTLSRLFQRETGMSFMRWRQQLHVGIALQRLAAGDLVNTIAGDLGYESVSAFIVMFRRMLGTTPARYFEYAGAGPSLGLQPKIQGGAAAAALDIHTPSNDPKRSPDRSQ